MTRPTGSDIEHIVTADVPELPPAIWKQVPGLRHRPDITVISGARASACAPRVEETESGAEIGRRLRPTPKYTEQLKSRGGDSSRNS
jgi:hypothetical protein